MKTEVINFFGGPGAGKSSSALHLTSIMKQKSILCELVSEFPKDLYWNENVFLMNEQISCFAEQNKRLYRLLGKVNYIINDCPLPIMIPYLWKTHVNAKWKNADWKYEFQLFIMTIYNNYDNINFYIEDDIDNFEQHGRKENRNESKIIHKEIFDFMNDNNINFKTLHKSTAVKSLEAWITKLN